jgi:alginate O-acetyltransferase complex protein AlgI
VLFNSLEFLVFLPVVFALYWFVARRTLRLQNLLLIGASYVFYGWWDWRFLSLIVVSSLVDFLVGLGLARTEASGRRKLLLLASLVTNLGLLGFFKYFDFFLDSFVDLLGTVGLQANRWSLGIILPVGISFYTFQTLSYTIDVYRRKIPSCRDPIAFFAFVSFFPQLVAGPIERAKSLLPQFQRERTFDLTAARDGCRQILWGFVKKVLIADNMAGHVETIFSQSDSLPGPVLVIGVFLFAIQIYGDFSGYSDIALGTARLFGFSLMRNFAYPYFSRNIAEFWRRWHISLSSWFRDYVYIPLGGSRTGSLGRLRNIILTFTISGFWHGANWTFVAWGFLNGLYYIPLMLAKSERKYLDTVANNRLLPGLREAGQILLTFALTLLAWVFFRARSLGHAFEYLAGIGSRALDLTGVDRLLPVVGLGLAFLAVEWLQRDRQHGLEIARKPLAVRWAVYYALIVVVLAFGSFGKQEFIYFQF